MQRPGYDVEFLCTLAFEYQISDTSRSRSEVRDVGQWHRSRGFTWARINAPGLRISHGGRSFARRYNPALVQIAIPLLSPHTASSTHRHVSAVFQGPHRHRHRRRRWTRQSVSIPPSLMSRVHKLTSVVMSYIATRCSSRPGRRMLSSTMSARQLHRKSLTRSHKVCEAPIPRLKRESEGWHGSKLEARPSRTPRP